MNYDRTFMKQVFSAALVSSVEQLMKAMMIGYSAIRIQYKTLENYLEIADHLKIMRDFKVCFSIKIYL